MKRVYLIISILLLSSLACGLVSRTTPVPTRTSQPAEVTSTQVPTEMTPSQVPSDTPAIQTKATRTPAAKATSEPTQEEPTRTPYPTSVLDAQMTRQINQIQSQVIEERGLQPKNPVPVVLLSPEELRQNVTTDFLADYTDEKVANDVMELTTIGLLEPGFDLYGFFTELYSEQVAGYYDNEVGEMFVVQGEGFEGPERLTYAHEYTHVLQDQTYDIEHGLNYNDESCEVDSERCGAIQALIEGDASLSEYTWFYLHATDQERQQVIDYYDSLKSPVYDTAPAFMQEDFVFPYNQGMTFVQSFFDNGGWSAVDDVYKDPPVSTEQILHPELYPSDKPIPVDLPDVASALGEGWKEITRNQMGEWYTYLILARAANEKARLDDTTAAAAAAGWGGDEYLVLHNDTTSSTAFVMKTVWDSTNEAAEFASSFENYANARFGVTPTQNGDTLTWTYSDGFSSFYHSGDTTIWIVAPDATTAQTITSQVQP
jgi:hypothetical protein